MANVRAIVSLASKVASIRANRGGGVGGWDTVYHQMPGRVTGQKRKTLELDSSDAGGKMKHPTNLSNLILRLRKVGRSSSVWEDDRRVVSMTIRRWVKNKH
jgi:hypothetical protein